MGAEHCKNVGCEISMKKIQSFLQRQGGPGSK